MTLTTPILGGNFSSDGKYLW